MHRIRAHRSCRTEWTTTISFVSGREIFAIRQIERFTGSVFAGVRFRPMAKSRKPVSSS